MAYNESNISLYNILLATDGSEYSKRAEKYAIELAKDNNGKITATTMVKNIWSYTVAISSVGVNK